MSHFIQLGPREWPADRSFADPALAVADCAILIRLINDLYLSRDREPEFGDHRRDRLITTASGRSHGENPVSIVGFFGERRIDACPDVTDQVETINAEMVDEFDEFPILLGYVSRKLDDGVNYANLVVLSGADGIEKWREMPRHVGAVVDLAPKFYASVRIYNGWLPNGLSRGDELRLRSVKFWDYRRPVVWQAVRTLSPHEAG